MTQPIYQVAPRYTGGSPAQVDEATALAIARQERATWERLKEAALKDATPFEDRGLDGIAECLVETPKHWDVLDLITEKRSTRPFSSDTQEDGSDQVTTALGQRGYVLIRLGNYLRVMADELVATRTAEYDSALEYALLDINALAERVTRIGRQRRDGIL